MIPIKSKGAKRILAGHLKETCPEHLNFLMEAGEIYGEVTIILPEDRELRDKLEKKPPHRGGDKST